MPFDSAPEIKEELRVLDRMREILAMPDKWCKGNVRDGDAVCVAGALYVADGSEPDAPLIVTTLSLAAMKSWGALVRTSRDDSGLFPAEFNDDPRTTHSDILSLIDRAREKIVAESLG
jgi:hypothetical protein